MLLMLLAGFCEPSLAAERAIETIAGTGRSENNGDSGPARRMNIGYPFGVEFGSDRALYITEIANHRVLRLDLKTQSITTVAGCGRKGYSGDGGPATAAELNEPYEVRFDAHGNMIFVEMKNNIIRKVDRRTNTISTIAGTGKKGFGGDGGPATEAQLSEPHSISIDESGAIYVADIGNHRIRRVDPTTGIIDTIAGTGNRRMPRDGQVARGNPLLGPRALCIHDNQLWIALREGHSVWRLDFSTGQLHHVGGALEPGYSGDGGPAIEAQFNGPKGIAVSRHEIVIVDSENNAVRAIDRQSGIVSTVVSRDHFNQPHGICIGDDGAIYVGDSLNGRVVRISAADR
jgi:streptogramin lyase